MRNPTIRSIVRTTETTISGGRRLRTWNDLLYTFPGLLGVKTGHTNGAGWSQVAAARGPGFVVYATLLGEPSRTRRNDDLTRLLTWGISQFRQMPIVKAGRKYATAALPYDKGRLGLVAARDQMRVLRLGKPLTQEVVSPRTVSLPVAKGQRLGSVRVYREGRLIASSPLVASRAVTAPGSSAVSGGTPARPSKTFWVGSRRSNRMIVTVTMNAALDRTLTVPNFKEGQRHRASEKLTLAGGKGITVARA